MPGVLIALALLLVGIPSASAWESDLHYGLTKWLALQAGFTEGAADDVAMGNWDSDHGVNAAPHLVTIYNCLLADAQASLLVRDNHFPTFESVPNPPYKRRVEAGGKAAVQRAEDAARRMIDSTYSPQQLNGLIALGGALHALQDSWSHQGVPDIPWFCRSRLAWGHPEERGGWRSHKADHTALWVDHALKAAEATYSYLLVFAQNNAWAVKQPPKSWSVLNDQVTVFAQAHSKTDKRAWFAARNVSGPDFLAGITIEEGKEPFPAFAGRPSFAKAPPPQPGVQVPPALYGFFEKFFGEWMVRREISVGFVDAFIDARRLASNLALPGNAKLTGITDARTIALSGMVAWRLRDHGLASHLGHGLLHADASSAAKTFQTLANFAAQPARHVTYTSVSDALVRLGKDGPLFYVGRMQDRYVAVAQFRHTPYDVVIVGADGSGADFRVVSLDWMVEH